MTNRGTVWQGGKGGHVIRLLLFVALVLGVPVSAPIAAPEKSIADSIGLARTIVRDVTAEEVEVEDDQRYLIVKDPVFQHEYVETLDVSATKLRFKDETEMTLGPKSKVLLDEFVYDADPTKNKMVLNMAKGVARFVSGKMTKSKYALKTPTATIGIRGTVVTMSVTDGKTDLFVKSGEAFVTSNSTGAQVDVPAGFKTSVPGQGDPTPPEPAPNGLDGTSVVEMDALIEIAGDDAGDENASGEEGGNQDGQDGEGDEEGEQEELLFDALEQSEELRGGYGCDC